MSNFGSSWTPPPAPPAPSATDRIVFGAVFRDACATARTLALLSDDEIIATAELPDGSVAEGDVLGWSHPPVHVHVKVGRKERRVVTRWEVLDEEWRMLWGQTLRLPLELTEFDFAIIDPSLSVS